MKLPFAEVISVVALLTSAYALFQTREANSPRVVVTPVAERSYIACNPNLERFEARSIIRFNISNVGGRAATLERLLPSPDFEPVVVRLSEVQKPATDFMLGRLENLGQLPAGAASPTWDLNPVFATAKPVLAQGDAYGRDKAAAALLNIPIEAGKAVTLDFAVSVPSYQAAERIEGVTLALVARFSHGEEIILRSTAETARFVGRGGQCRRTSQ